MRRIASLGAVGAWLFGLIATSWSPAAAYADQCRFNPVENAIVCTASGGTPGTGSSGGGSGGGTSAPLDPIRYVYTATDPSLGDCYYWSRVPGGIDAWDNSQNHLLIPITVGLPECPGLSAVLSPAEVAARAWEVFRAFPLAGPEPAFEPPEQGITGLPTYVSVIDPVPITHTETLPDGRTLEVRARAATLAVAWGDGGTDTYAPGEAAPYPTGAATHVYLLKTCSASYRAEHPSGGNCHPSLDEYAVSTTFTWSGDYTVGGGWTELGTLDLTTDIAYDVDEVQGVLQP